jgi:hypothetical protein
MNIKIAVILLVAVFAAVIVAVSMYFSFSVDYLLQTDSNQTLESLAPDATANIEKDLNNLPSDDAINKELESFNEEVQGF